jgi:hypothetical protein
VYVLVVAAGALRLYEVKKIKKASRKRLPSITKNWGVY